MALSPEWKMHPQGFIFWVGGPDMPNRAWHWYGIPDDDVPYMVIDDPASAPQVNDYYDVGDSGIRESKAVRGTDGAIYTAFRRTDYSDGQDGGWFVGGDGSLISKWAAQRYTAPGPVLAEYTDGAGVSWLVTPPGGRVSQSLMNMAPDDSPIGGFFGGFVDIVLENKPLAAFVTAGVADVIAPELFNFAPTPETAYFSGADSFSFLSDASNAPEFVDISGDVFANAGETIMPDTNWYSGEFDYVPEYTTPPEYDWTISGEEYMYPSGNDLPGNPGGGLTGEEYMWPSGNDLPGNPGTGGALPANEYMWPSGNELPGNPGSVPATGGGGDLIDKIITKGTSAAGTIIARVVTSVITGQKTQQQTTLPPGARVVTVAGKQIIVDSQGRPINAAGQSVVNSGTGRAVRLPSGALVPIPADGAMNPGGVSPVLLAAGAAALLSLLS